MSSQYDRNERAKTFRRQFGQSCPPHLSIYADAVGDLPRYIWRSAPWAKELGLAPRRVPNNWASFTDAEELRKAAFSAADLLNSEASKSRGPKRGQLPETLRIREAERAIAEAKNGKRRQLAEAKEARLARVRACADQFQSPLPAVASGAYGRHYLYIAGAVTGPQKIGITDDPDSRAVALRYIFKNPSLRLWLVLGGQDISTGVLERAVHVRLAPLRVDLGHNDREWFDLNPSQAKIAVSEELIMMQMMDAVEAAF